MILGGGDVLMVCNQISWWFFDRVFKMIFHECMARSRVLTIIFSGLSTLGC